MFLLLTVAGCTERIESSYPEAVCVEASIDESGVEYPGTRTLITGTTASWKSGDAIGLFETLTGQFNVQYAYNGIAWNAVTSSANWRMTGNPVHTFYAYYPHKSSASGTNVSMPVLAGQTGGTTVNPAMDMLVAGPYPQQPSASVGLTFTHAFSLLQFNVKMGILGLLSAYSLNSFTVQGGNPTATGPYGLFNKAGGSSDVGYNLLTKTVVADVNTSDRFAQSLKINLSGISILYTAAKLYVLVLPGTYTNPVPAVSFNLSLLGILLPTDTTFASGVLGNNTFLPGTKYVYDVSIVRLSLAAAPEVRIVQREVVPIERNILNTDKL